MVVKINGDTRAIKRLLALIVGLGLADTLEIYARHDV
jgi:hypothetical protein